MRLVVDVGNTNTVLGIYQERKLLHRWRVASDPGRTADEHALQLRGFCDAAGLKLDQIEDVVIGSVVPALTQTYRQAVESLFEFSPLQVSADLDVGLQFGYHDPHQIGADRIANAVAAYEMYHGPVIVVDFGQRSVRQSGQVASLRGDPKTPADHRKDHRGERSGGSLLRHCGAGG